MQCYTIIKYNWLLILLLSNDVHFFGVNNAGNKQKDMWKVISKVPISNVNIIFTFDFVFSLCTLQDRLDIVFRFRTDFTSY